MFNHTRSKNDHGVQTFEKAAHFAFAGCHMASLTGRGGEGGGCHIASLTDSLALLCCSELKVC